MNWNGRGILLSEILYLHLTFKDDKDDAFVIS